MGLTRAALRHWPGWRQGALAALGGGVAALGQAPASLPLLTVAGFALVFALFARIGGPGRAAWTGLAFGTGYFAVALHWLVEPFLVDIARHGWMAPFALALMSVGLALFWAAAFWAARRISPGGLALIVTLPLAELGRAYLFSGFPWAMPSQVLIDGLAGQALAWVGPHGMNLALMAVAAALGQARRSRGVAALGVLLLAPVLWRLDPPPPVPGDAPVVRIVQPNAPQHQKWDPAHSPVFFDRATRATAAGPDRPDLIVWPETSVPVVLNHAKQTLERMAGAAAGVPVLAGINRFDDLRAMNSAVLIDPQGQVTQLYDKHHLVPFGEYMPFGDALGRLGLRGLAARHGNGYSAGPGPRLIDLGALGRALPLICYEVVFPQVVHAAPARPDMLIQITNDAWFGRFSGPYQHLAQARMRAIEQGLPVIRAANTGVSAMIDARGRVRAALALNETGYLDAPLPPARPATPYARTGDLPLAALMGLLAAALLWRAARKVD